MSNFNSDWAQNGSCHSCWYSWAREKNEAFFQCCWADHCWHMSPPLKGQHHHLGNGKPSFNNCTVSQGRSKSLQVTSVNRMHLYSFFLLEFRKSQRHSWFLEEPPHPHLMRTIWERTSDNHCPKICPLLEILFLVQALLTIIGQSQKLSTSLSISLPFNTGTQFLSQ